jgi:heme-degrading monooxygenase HmoA
MHFPDILPPINTYAQEDRMTTERPGYAYIWQYVVGPEFEEDFENAYGPDGPWVELFRCAGGYIRTELYRDRQNPSHYLTIDYWESFEAYQGFRNSMASKFEEIDAQCEKFTLEEKELGRLFPPRGL